MEATLELDPRPVDSDAPNAGTLCVHFAASGSEHSIWLAGCDEAAGGIGRASILWRDTPGPIAHGRVVFGRGAACDCLFLMDGDARGEREVLRALGVPRERASLLARMPHRPLLVTTGRDGDLDPAMVRRLHRLLLSTVPQRVAAN